jgi:hypothetical protein
MYKSFRSKFAFAAVVLFTLAIAASAGRKPPTGPGKYEEWGPNIDRIEIVQSFRLADYTTVVVEPLDVSATPRDADADVRAKVESVLRDATGTFVEGMAKKMTTLAVVATEPRDAAKTLLVRAKVTVMDPGSRGKRLVFGYGAGAARAAIEGEIVDAQSGDVLVRFEQERLSGIERFGRGSSYEEIMKRNVQTIGQDVANLLKVF